MNAQDENIILSGLDPFALFHVHRVTTGSGRAIETFEIVLTAYLMFTFSKVAKILRFYQIVFIEVFQLLKRNSQIKKEPKEVIKLELFKR